MEIENLKLQSQIDSLQNLISSQGTKITSIEGDISNIKEGMGYLYPLKLYTGTSNLSNYPLSNSTLNDLSMYDMIIIFYRVHNGSVLSTRSGGAIIPFVNGLTFMLHAEWLAGTDSIWDSRTQYKIDISNKRLVKDFEYDYDGTNTMHIVITDVYGICDADLILSGLLN